MASLENPFNLVEEGGTRIIVTYKKNRVVGMVSPYAMALASPVWKKFIFPPFRQMPPNSDTAVFLERAGTTKNIDDTVVLETAGTTESSQPVVTEKIATSKLETSNLSVEPTEEIDFAEDPAEALLILLNITHFRFTKVPLTLPLDTLSDIAILCDQYDCVHLVKPWLSEWLADESTGWKAAVYVFGGSSREKWLFVAWVFGREQVLKDFSSSIVRNLCTHGEGDCTALEAINGPMPPELVGKLNPIFNVVCATIFRCQKIVRLVLRFSRHREYSSSSSSLHRESSSNFQRMHRPLYFQLGRLMFTSRRGLRCNNLWVSATWSANPQHSPEYGR